MNITNCTESSSSFWKLSSKTSGELMHRLDQCLLWNALLLRRWPTVFQIQSYYTFVSANLGAVYLLEAVIQLLV